MNIVKKSLVIKSLKKKLIFLAITTQKYIPPLFKPQTQRKSRESPKKKKTFRSVLEPLHRQARKKIF